MGKAIRAAQFLLGTAMVFSISVQQARADDRQTGQNALETVIVTAGPSAGIDPDKVPGEFETLNFDDTLRDRREDVLPDAVATQLSGVSLNDEQGGEFQPDFVYRGFEASPISGVAEGIAVYQNGVRLNEVFGDTINWDLIPDFAVERFTLESSAPAFGLNAMGGAVNLLMKDGFGFSGASTELSGGSHGDMTGDAQYGLRDGPFGVYIGIGGARDDGFRYDSAADTAQVYSDLGYESGRSVLHLTLAGAQSDIAAPGPAPVQMLAADLRAVFTVPQSMRNAMALVQLRGDYRVLSDLDISVNFYYRRFAQHLVDGNTTDVTSCLNDPAQLCLEGADEFPGDALYDSEGVPVPASVLPPGTTPGEIDFTRTRTDGFGSAGQLSFTAPLLGLPNDFVAGISFDTGFTDYEAFGELGELSQSLKVIGDGIVIDQRDSPTASPPLEEPVAVGARNVYTGFYVVDVLDLTSRLSWTFSGRFNFASIGIEDRAGGDAGGRHAFARFNPGIGATFKVVRDMTAYIGYSESGRAPTAGELSCADPASPCLLDAFLVSDPPLKQIVSRDVELGLRGGFTVAVLPGDFAWSAAAYNINVSNDIMLLASPTNGFGFFQNAGTTRHRGLDLHLGYKEDGWNIAANYTYLEATFRNAEILSSNSPAADGNGDIFVRSGDRLPLSPAMRAVLSVDYRLAPNWSAGLDMRVQSGQYLAGDESNQETKLPGFLTTDLHGAYRAAAHLELFAEIKNLFDKRYDTYGSFTDLDNLPANIALNDPRSVSPAPGRAIFVGLRLRF